jgi:WD40 repeat protein
VYRARQRRLERIVAVKVLAAGELANAEARRRFRVEAEAAARLQHPGIVTIHDVGESEGLPWLSDGFCRGGKSRRRSCASNRYPRGRRRTPCAPSRRPCSTRTITAFCTAISNPRTFLLDPESGPRVTDFGIARCADAGEHTRTGEVLGSPGYTAPEQALSGAADARTDVYGLGALLYHLITARPPFQGPTLNAIMLQLRDADPLTPRRLNPAVPRDLETICLHCLRKNPANRYATARDVADDLARFLRGEPIHARPISAFGKTWRWCRRRPAIAALLAVVAVVAVLAFGLIDAARRNESAAKQRAEFASAQLRDANTRLAESLDDAELERAENLFQTGESADALALLARIVRRTPMHRVAAPRLASALWHGDFALPVLPPFHGGGYVLRMQFLRDGKTLLVFQRNGIATWDAATGRRLVVFEHDGTELSHAVLSPDESTSIAWHNKPGMHLRIFDAQTGRLRAEPLQHEGWIHTVSFSPDGTKFVTAGTDPVARIFESATGAQSGEPLVHSTGLWSAKFDPRGERMATCSAQTVRVWNAQTHKLQLELPPLQSEVQVLEFSPDGRWLFAGCLDGTMRLFSSDSGEPAGLAMRHTDRVRFAAFSTDGGRLVTASSDRTARVWAVPDGEPLTPPLRHRDAVNFATFSRDGGRVVTCATDHAARVWDVGTGDAVSQPLHHIEQPLAAAFTPDGTTLYTSGADGIVRRWELRGPAVAQPDEARPLPAPSNTRISAGGRLTLTLDANKPFAMLSNAGTDKQIGGLPTDFDRITGAEFSPDSTLLVTTSTDKTARVWDARTGAPITSVRHTRWVTNAAFSPDSARLATASWDGTARIWDARTGAPLTPPLTHEGHVTDVEFSPDGRRVLTASRDMTVRLWDAASGQPLSGPLRHDAPVEQVRFELGGERVVASMASVARIWDAPDFPTPPPEWLAPLAEMLSLSERPTELPPGSRSSPNTNRHAPPQCAKQATVPTRGSRAVCLARHPQFRLRNSLRLTPDS